MFARKRPNKFFYILTLLVFLAQLALPTGARAEGETPPPADPAATEVATEAAPADAATPEPAPAATEAATPEPVLDLSAVPDGTELVVLDENGQPLPLASEAAAEVVAQGDPIWCPGSQNPHDSTTGCSASYTTLTDLLAAEDENLWADGTIWIEKGIYDGGSGHNAVEVGTTAGGSNYAVRLNGGGNANSLTIQGGWNSSTGAIDGTSTYILPLNFVWGGNLTIQNITYDGTTATNDPDFALNISDYGRAVTLDHVNVLNAHNKNGTAIGAYIAGLPTVNLAITDSNFNSNQSTGLTTDLIANVTLTGVDASNNASGVGGYGASIACSSANDCANGTVTITSSTFNGNGSGKNSTQGWGLQVITSGTITVEGVTANGNTADGAQMNNSYGTKPLTISNSTFGSTATLASLYVASAPNDPAASLRASAGNGELGLKVDSKGVVTLNGVTADYNYLDGARLQVVDTGTITVGSAATPSHFNHNSGNGIQAESESGAVTLNSVVATDNGYSGAVLGQLSSNVVTTGNYTITGGTFSNNGGQTYHPSAYAYDGLNVKTNGNISVDGITANGNAQSGASLNTNNGNASNTGTVTVTNSTFGTATSIFRDGSTYAVDPRTWGNGAHGLEIVSGGLVSLDTVTANFNGSAYQNAGSNGISVSNTAAGGIALANVTADFNYNSGASLISAYDLDVTNSNFSYNRLYGIMTDGGANQNFTDTNANFNGYVGLLLTALDMGGHGYGYPNSPSGGVTLSGVTAHDNGKSDANNPAPGIATSLSSTFTCSNVNSFDNGEDDHITCASGSGGSGGSGSGSGGATEENGIITYEVAGGQNVTLSCTAGLVGYQVKAPGYLDSAFLPCDSLSENQAQIAAVVMVSENELPGGLVAGVSQYEFVSALEVQLSAPLTGSMRVNFDIPAGLQGSNFTILHWNGISWDELGGYANNGQFSVDTNQGGIFVLVIK